MYLIHCRLCIHAILDTTNDTSKRRNSKENDSCNFIVIKFRDAFDDTQKDKLHDGENGNDDDKSDKDKTSIQPTVTIADPREFETNFQPTQTLMPLD